MKPITPGITSEIGRLEAVVIHRPGAEFDRMWPENIAAYRHAEDGSIHANPDYLLFDDLVLLPQLREEHDQLAAVLRAVTGPDGVLDVREVLRRALYDEQARAAVLEAAIEADRETYAWEVTVAQRRALERMDPDMLAMALVLGSDPATGERLFRWPMPNLLFTRDLGAVVGEAIVLTHARENARSREMAMMRRVYGAHPMLRQADLLDIGALGVPVPALEGGDIEVLSDRVVVVGVGVRTELPAVRRLAPLLHARGVEVVLAVTMPERRATMHLDTLFTRISESECLAYGPALGLSAGDPGEAMQVFRIDGSDVRKNPKQLGVSLLRALERDGIALEPVLCGGGDPVTQAREQWSDGANAFALAPGKILCYGRNLATLRELNAAGYEILEVPDFVRNATLILANPARKVAVTIQGGELSRGRGGPRCLTMPLRRVG
jgi:arginine deiminase